MTTNPTRRAFARLTLAASIAMLGGPIFAADTLANLDGTWSGDWMVKGSTPDAVTVQLSVDKNKLSGQFLSPVRMDCTTATFTAATRRVVLEAVDEQSKTHYKLVGKLAGTEILGTIESGEKTGTIRLIKWTYFPTGFGS